MRVLGYLMTFDALSSAYAQWKIRVQETLGALRKSLLNPRQWPRKRHWILLLGLPGSGKTTLLKFSGLALKSPHGVSLDTVKTTKTITFWLSDNALWVDPTGEHLSNPAIQSVWDQTVQFLQSRHSSLFDHIYLVLDAPTLMTHFLEESLPSLGEKLIPALWSLLQRNKRCTWTLVITQCDRLTGFTDFFSHLSAHDRKHTWGINFPEVSGNEFSFLEQLHTQKLVFLKSISEKVLPRLHHEPNLVRRHRMKDFPYQMEQIITSIEIFLEKSLLVTVRPCTSIYFTSAEQKGKDINPVQQLIAKQFPLTPTTSPGVITKSKSYFIEELFTSVLKNIPTRPMISYLAASILLVLSLMVLIVGKFGYEKNLAAFQTIELHLASLANKNDLTELDELKKLLTQLKPLSLPWFQVLGFTKASTLQHDIQTAYHQKLVSLFLPYLNQQLEQKLQTAMQTKSNDLYGTLRIYLLLNQTRISSSASTQITDWFTKIWQAANLPPNTIERLTGHLATLLTLPPRSTNLSNPAVIRQAQQVLQDQPLPNIIFSILQSNYSDTKVPLFTKRTREKGIDVAQAQIPILYSNKNRDKICQSVIPDIVTHLFKESWILGTYRDPVLTAAQKQLLTKETCSIYLSHYKAAWEEGISGIKLIPAKDFDELIDRIQLLQDPESLLWKMLKGALTNAVVAGKSNSQNSVPVTPSALISPSRQELLQGSDVQNNLTALKSYIENITKAISPLKANFDATLLRLSSSPSTDPIAQLQALATYLPPPLKGWITQLAQNSWFIMLNNSRQYLNIIWTSTIWPEYKAHIANRYPVFNKSRVDITLEHFNHFFGPQGTLETFFNNYLKPFVDIQKIYWTWKTYESQQISIPQEKLDMLIRASMIQKMFYSHHTNNPELNFTLTPIRLSPNIIRFTVNIGGKTAESEPGVKKPASLSWPGPSGTFINLHFNGVNVEQPDKTFEGPWAWLRLIDQSHLKNTSEPKVFRVTFQVEGQEAEFELTAENAVNPYQGEFLSAFRCPEDW